MTAGFVSDAKLGDAVIMDGELTPCLWISAIADRKLPWDVDLCLMFRMMRRDVNSMLAFGLRA